MFVLSWTANVFAGAGASLIKFVYRSKEDKDETSAVCDAVTRCCSYSVVYSWCGDWSVTEQGLTCTRHIIDHFGDENIRDSNYN